jgi:hypothetical protein
MSTFQLIACGIVCSLTVIQMRQFFEMESQARWTDLCMLRQRFRFLVLTQQLLRGGSLLAALAMKNTGRGILKIT